MGHPRKVHWEFTFEIPGTEARAPFVTMMYCCMFNERVEDPRSSPNPADVTCRSCLAKMAAHTQRQAMQEAVR